MSLPFTPDQFFDAFVRYNERFWPMQIGLNAMVPEYLESRDPVSGAVYLLMLGLFALMPWLVARR